MRLWPEVALTVLSLLCLGLWVALRAGSALWGRKTSQLIDRFLRPVPTGERVSLKATDGLPPPVARYFRFALKEGQPMVGSASVTHTGEFNDGRRWSPFTSTEHFSARPPGFVWDAAIRMNRFMTVRVRDASVEGRGSMEARLFSVIPVVDEKGKSELDEGALQRYLAEAVWLPTALLPSAGVRWTGIDDSRATATLTASGVTVSLEFLFSGTGEITGCLAQRYRAVKGGYEQAVWAGHFSSYEERAGMRIPTEGYVEWQLPEGNIPYWRGRIAEAKYDFA